MEKAIKRCLFISPTPTHPANAGNRVHVLSLTRLLAQHGFEVHFLYIATENFDKESMLNYFQNRLYIVPNEGLFKPFYRAFYRRVYYKFRRLYRWLQKLAGKINEHQYRYNGETDYFFPPGAVSLLKHLRKQIQFDMVICEYVFISRALSFFDDRVFKVLDTHDRFTDRFRIYLDSKKEPEWVSLYKDQEKKALNRANLVLAVLPGEKKYFESITKAEVIQYNYVPEQVVLPDRIFDNKLLYFASNNLINQSALHFFIQSVLPLIAAKHPTVQLLVGGSICRSVTEIYPHVNLAGEFENASEFYSSGDIVINPELNGTGYKIKTIEALSFGLPVVSTTLGAAGALDPFLEHILIADEAGTFAETICRLFEQPSLRANISQNAVKWFNQYRKKISVNLLQHLPG